jgi:hypothetical protein
MELEIGLFISLVVVVLYGLSVWYRVVIKNRRK